MVKLVVAYGPPEDAAAFDQYYADTHAPLAQAIPGLRNFEAGKVLGTPDGSAAPYHLIAQLSFDDMGRCRRRSAPRRARPRRVTSRTSPPAARR